MHELYLICHKVRGEATFDIAEKMECPLCEAGCVECDGLRFWWIVGTSGHRAYPWWSTKLDDCLVEGMGEYESITYGIPEMPPSWPDHFTPLRPQKINIKALFKAEPKQYIARRL